MAIYYTDKNVDESGHIWFTINGDTGIVLASARLAGYNNDKKTFTRLVIESRINIAELNKQWGIGQKLRAKEVTP